MTIQRQRERDASAPDRLQYYYYTGVTRDDSGAPICKQSTHCRRHVETGGTFQSRRYGRARRPLAERERRRRAAPRRNAGGSAGTAPLRAGPPTTTRGTTPCRGSSASGSPGSCSLSHSLSHSISLKLSLSSSLLFKLSQALSLSLKLSLKLSQGFSSLLSLSLSR